MLPRRAGRLCCTLRTNGFRRLPAIMPLTRHHSGRWLYQFDREIPGVGRKRSNKLLPKGWTRAQAEAFDVQETARRYAVETGVQRETYLIDVAVTLYLEQRAPHLKNREDIEGAFLHLYPYIVDRPMEQLADVAREYMAQAVGESGKPLQPGTIRNRLAYLRSACRWAWRHHKMGEHDPAERMILPTVKNARQVYLTRADMLRIARSMGMTWARDVVRIAFYTGMRAGEILRSEVTPEGLKVADTKNGTPRLVPVHPAIAHLTRGQWPPQITLWTASKAFKAAARGVGLGHARLHDLRHSAASEMVNSGVDLYTVGAVLGHKSQVSTARYSHLATAKLRDAVGKIGRKKSQPRPEAKAA
jgi:integrase